MRMIFKDAPEKRWTRRSTMVQNSGKVVGRLNLRRLIGASAQDARLEEKLVKERALGKLTAYDWRSADKEMADIYENGADEEGEADGDEDCDGDAEHPGADAGGGGGSAASAPEPTGLALQRMIEATRMKNKAVVSVRGPGWGTPALAATPATDGIGLSTAHQ